MNREPPYSLQCEENVLGALFLNPESLDDVCEIVTAQDFYSRANQQMFECIRGMYASREPIDLGTVTDRLRRLNLLEEVGGLSHVISLANDTPSAANVMAYAKQVRDYATLRGLICAGGDIAELGYRPEARPASELVDLAQQSVMALGERLMTVGPEDIGSLADAYWEMLERKRETGEVGISTGFYDLDGKTGGLQPSDLVIVAGRPGMGKTALAVNIADFVSRERQVLIFSMEMSREQVTGRLLSALAKIDGNLLKDPRQLTNEQNDKLTEAVKAIKRQKVIIDDRGGLSVLQVRAKARKVSRKGRLGLIVVDYLQLMTGAGGNRNEELNDITRSLKALAKEINCPIIALSQLNRGCEQRDNKRPRLSDLRESGGIEQDADIVLAVYRDDYYTKDSPHEGVAECLILKQRNGAQGTVELAWIPQFCQFENYTGPDFKARLPKEDEKPKRGFSRARGPLVELVRSNQSAEH